VCCKDRDLRFWRFLRELAINTTKGRLLNQIGPLLAPRLASRPPHTPPFAIQSFRAFSQTNHRTRPCCLRPRLKGNYNGVLRKTSPSSTHGGGGCQGSKHRGTAEEATLQASMSSRLFTWCWTREVVSNAAVE
jgi:hypothetical protein